MPRVEPSPALLAPAPHRERRAASTSQARAQLAATGPRARGARHEYELLLEMILEGSRLHYGRPWWSRPTTPIWRCCWATSCYALGLSRLAALGDLDAVGRARRRDLARSPRRTARPTPTSPARSGRPARSRSAGVPSEAHRRAKARARAHERGADRSPRGRRDRSRRRRLRLAHPELALVTLVARL